LSPLPPPPAAPPPPPPPRNCKIASAKSGKKLQKIRGPENQDLFIILFKLML